MLEIQTLREQMANIATEARAKLSEVTDEVEETRAAEIEAEFDRMMSDNDRLCRTASYCCSGQRSTGVALL